MNSGNLTRTLQLCMHIPVAATVSIQQTAVRFLITRMRQALHLLARQQLPPKSTAHPARDTRRRASHVDLEVDALDLVEGGGAGLSDQHGVAEVAALAPGVHLGGGVRPVELGVGAVVPLELPRDSVIRG